MSLATRCTDSHGPSAPDLGNVGRRDRWPSFDRQSAVPGGSPGSADNRANRPTGPPTRHASVMAHGLAIFAGVIMIMVGAIQGFNGLVAVFQNEFYVSTPNYIFHFDVSRGRQDGPRAQAYRFGGLACAALSAREPPGLRSRNQCRGRANAAATLVLQIFVDVMPQRHAAGTSTTPVPRRFPNPKRSISATGPTSSLPWWTSLRRERRECCSRRGPALAATRCM
jgi:hypothetical protein